MDFKLEVVVIPVSDVDRASDFYKTLGWRLDADVVGRQRLPPGAADPAGLPVLDPLRHGSHDRRAGHGPVPAPRRSATSRRRATSWSAAASTVSPVFHCAAGLRAAGTAKPGQYGPRVPGPSRSDATYASFATFADPDGNGWVLQEITTRLPGR